MIDLHMHTTYSDGTTSLIENLKLSEKMKLEFISITDHNDVRAYEELKNLNINDYFNGEIINGIEINTYLFGTNIELLIYDYDLDIMMGILSKYFPTKKKEIY